MKKIFTERYEESTQKPSIKGQHETTKQPKVSVNPVLLEAKYDSFNEFNLEFNHERIEHIKQRVKLENVELQKQQFKQQEESVIEEQSTEKSTDEHSTEEENKRPTRQTVQTQKKKDMHEVECKLDEQIGPDNEETNENDDDVDYENHSEESEEEHSIKEKRKKKKVVKKQVKKKVIKTKEKELKKEEYVLPTINFHNGNNGALNKFIFSGNTCFGFYFKALADITPTMALQIKHTKNYSHLPPTKNKRSTIFKGFSQQKKIQILSRELLEKTGQLVLNKEALEDKFGEEIKQLKDFVYIGEKTVNKSSKEVFSQKSTKHFDLEKKGNPLY